MTSTKMANKYASLTHPSMKEAIHLHNYTMIKLAVLVSEFAQQMAVAHELFSKELQTVLSTFCRRSSELKNERPVTTPCTIFKAWEHLLQQTESDAQAHLDAANLLINNVYKPLQEVAAHKNSQTKQLIAFRELMERYLEQSETTLQEVEKKYKEAFQELVKNRDDEASREVAKVQVHNCHNEYVLCLRATNQGMEEFQHSLPEILEEMEEIYIDTSNTVNVALEGHALLMLTKATEQHRRFEDQLKVCTQVSPQLDVSFFVSAYSSEMTTHRLLLHHFNNILPESEPMQLLLRNQIVFNESTEKSLTERRVSLQHRGMELASTIKQSQNRNNDHINACPRNLVKHQYAKLFEAQEEMCRKRNEIRISNMQLAVIKAQMEMLTQKQNGSLNALSSEAEEDEHEDKKEHTATIKGLWKKAFKSLKSGDQKWLVKKSSSLKRKDSKETEEVEPEEPTEIDPVYSLLKCAADLPKVSRGGKDSAGASGGLVARHGDSSGSTSKASSPSSSASHSPKTRRKKLNARMKSFSLDTPDPPKQLLSIDEATKKKSNSFTNTCFGATGSTSPSEPINAPQPSAKKKFAWSHRSSSLEIEDRKRRSRSVSPSGSPRSKKKDLDTYIVLYHFRGKEKDDMDLRAGTRIQVSNSSDPDWWKGKFNGKSGYFPAKYVLRVEPSQHIYQVLRNLSLTEMDGLSGIRLHKDQIVFQVGPEVDGMMQVRSASNRECLCPVLYIQEV